MLLWAVPRGPVLPLVLLPVLLFVGCATPGAAPAPQTPSPTDATTTTPAAVPTVAFRACAGDPPRPGTTHLAPPASVGFPASPPDVPAMTGPVHLEHAVTLRLPTGSLLGGPGADAVWASSTSGAEPFPVADGPVDADVTVEVWDPGDGGRVAWLELSFADAEVVRWASVDGLGILTDGGDGGFWSPAAPPVDLEADGTLAPDDLGAAFDAYLAAADPPGRLGPLCLVRSTDGVDDGVVFSTGVGDGGYPTYAGYDAEGRVVSVLSDGGMPWETAGTTGGLPVGYAPLEE
ncbi:DUF4241 domain-containing protein [Kineococcus endophyticus]|uniref:DUF4241 domain-containing protein n=1 Tax=Kineococcus endophyticus TaxID=1181883 RepID=A0ABV3PA99_9ACTN